MTNSLVIVTVTFNSDLSILRRQISALPHEDLPMIYCSSGAAIAPSISASRGDREGLRLTAIEALACGCPAIVSNSRSFSDFVVDGFNGLVVTERDVEALSDAIIRLAGDSDLQHRLREGARPSVKQFDWGTVAKRYESILASAQQSAKAAAQ